MKIAIATTTRADWGLLSPLAKALQQRGDTVLVMAANMHFNPALGLTVREIEADGFTPVLRCEQQGSATQIAAACLIDFHSSLREHEPDCIVCLGDRFEMLSVAQSAVMAGVPVVHIAGGAVSEGAMDDYFRNALTKLAWLHFAECEHYRERIIAMGEHPARVINTGAIGIHNISSLTPIPRSDLEAELQFPLDGDTLLSTMHIATQSALSPEEQYDQFLLGVEMAMRERPALRVLFTYPNNDTDPAPLIARLKEFRDRHPERVKLIPSLGLRRYISALHYAAGVVGNSSSGIVEVASMGIPVLDIGERQHGRMRALSVIHADCRAADIAVGVERLFSPELRRLASRKDNPYARPDTLSLMLASLTSEAFEDSHSKTLYMPCATSI